MYQDLASHRRIWTDAALRPVVFCVVASNLIQFVRDLFRGPWELFAYLSPGAVFEQSLPDVLGFALASAARSLVYGSPVVAWLLWRRVVPSELPKRSRSYSGAWWEQGSEDLLGTEGSIWHLTAGFPWWAIGSVVGSLAVESLRCVTFGFGYLSASLLEMVLGRGTPRLISLAFFYAPCFLAQGAFFAFWRSFWLGDAERIGVLEKGASGSLTLRTMLGETEVSVRRCLPETRGVDLRRCTPDGTLVGRAERWFSVEPTEELEAMAPKRN